MRSCDILTIARRRAGLSQAALAERMGIARTNVTRWESGAVLPSLERLSDAVEACGLELSTELHTFNDHYSALIGRELKLGALERVSSMGGRPEQLLAAAGALEASGVPYVAVGAIAACLRGSPVSLGGADLEVMVEAGAAVGMIECLAERGVKRGVRIGSEIPNTRGVRDLLADSDSIELVEGTTLETASTIDLRRIAEHPAAGPQPTPAVLDELLRIEASVVREESRRRVQDALAIMAS